MYTLKPIRIALIILLNFFALAGQGQYLKIAPEWSGITEINQNEKSIVCSNCNYTNENGHLPIIKRVMEGSLSYSLVQSYYSKCSEDEIKLIEQLTFNFDKTIQVEYGVSNKKEYTIISVIPFRKNAIGVYEKLDSLIIQLNKSASQQIISNIKTSATNSVLANGEWLKIGVGDNGIYKVDYNFLEKNGLIKGDVPTHELKLYGNGGGMLPLSNNGFRYDDLQENAIQIIDNNNDGMFSNGDYFIFYGSEQTTWNWQNNEKKFVHSKNLFSDSTYYFITINNNGIGKRIQDSPSLTGTPATRIVNQFIDCAYHEKDDYNFIKSGRNWYGDAFDIDLNQSFNFNFPNIIPGNVKLSSAVISRTSTSSFSSSKFSVIFNGSTLLNQTISNVGTNYTDDFARANTANTSFYNANDNINLNYIYTPYNSSSTGWIDFIELNAIRSLKYGNGDLLFRDIDTINQNATSQYIINNLSGNEKIWNITDKTTITNQLFDSNGNSGIFHSNTQLNQANIYYIFNNSFKTPNVYGLIKNQNLHGLPQSDLIIVTPSEFKSEAERLANFRRSNDGMKVSVATTEEIFNEFSSGSQDVAAIRDFIKMFYDRSSSLGTPPKYVLLFGDGSYDPKNRIGGNTNFITTFQSENSISLIGSYTSDDFFGMLDANEGTLAGAEIIDVGIGRIPVRDITDARLMIDKIITYETPGNTASFASCSSNNSIRFGDWRNVLCFVADDQDRNLHFRQSERIAATVSNNNPVYNIDKIVSDAYEQQSTPGGQRYPEVNEAINKRIEKGAFLINYTGHGGELGWSAESILNIDMINSWSNINSMPAFITATCEFSRFDDPKRTAAGELVLLNNKGGGICLFTTVRLAFALDNEVINADLLKYMFTPINGEMPRIGDIQRLAKMENPGNRNVTLLGDPSLKLAYPTLKVVTDEIKQDNVVSDTLKALSKITITGKVIDGNNNLQTSFNGTVYTTIYDKSSMIYTLVNDATGNDVSLPDSFLLRKNIIYRGKSSVTNGIFTCNFIVPKDINYQFGVGRLSYYAHDALTDGNGSDEQVIIGGLSSNGLNDQDGPSINLFLNDKNFTAGGMTNEHPSIFALLVDSSGINTVGNGIGHDITAILDNNQQSVLVLNDYYESELNSYQKGTVNYKLSDLSEGAHTLTLKAWDINGNSSNSTTDFVVSNSSNLALDHVLNYPNPFTTNTTFYFEHNKPCTGMTIQVQIYTVSGKLIKTLSDYQICDGYKNNPLTWDGKDDFGDRIGKGAYIYRLKIRTADGETAEKMEKLVILR
ncbi:MAG: type IX secretion system sortase PorU [Bacteroidota bacterium]